MNEVEAVKSPAHIEQIAAHLLSQGSEDMADVWHLGINVALRISDLLSIQYTQIDPTRRELRLREAKTRKLREIRLNRKAMAIIERRQSSYPHDKFIFQSHGSRGKNQQQPLHRRRSSLFIRRSMGANENPHHQSLPSIFRIQLLPLHHPIP